MRNMILQLFSDAAAATDSAAEQSQDTSRADESQETAEQAGQHNEETAEHEAPDEPAVSAPQENAEDILQQQRIERGRAKMQDWMQQGEQLKAFYPSFSLRDEYNSNEEFAYLLRVGVSVRQAYEATHLPQILSTAMRYAAQKAAEKTANAMRNAAFRPQENGLHDRRAGLPTDKTVDSLTQTDIIRILERVGKGDKITF